MADRVGQQLGNYHLLRVLGEGAFATVYLGEHQYLERPAAMKVLRVQVKPRSHDAFRREARTIAQLQHPHIIGVYDFGIEDQTPYLVMEYTPNGTLRARHPRGTPLSFEQILIYVKQIASALDYAHEQHVIHRDIKPENVLVNAKQEIVLSDFGIAVVQPTLDSLSTQSPAGTPLYMAPEQIRGKPCAASDQYGLGVMVYEWLTGSPPFHGSLFEVLNQHLHEPPPSLRTRLKELPSAIEDAVFGALAKDPRQRFPTVQDFATVLSEAFFATQTLSQSQSVEHSVQEEIKHPLARVGLVPVPSASEQDSSGEATQPRLKTAQRIDHLPELGSSVSPQPARRHQSAPKQPSSTHQQVRASLLQNQNRVRMLRRLRRSYTEMMSQSLQGATWLELSLADKLDAVQNATNLFLRMERSTEELLPAGASITQAYDEAEHELLILGEPGAGKSTLLLDLAQQLILRAEEDQTHPLPVILPLSSWAVKRPSLQDWIAEQMSEVYDVPRKVSVQWVQEGSILPLLDGLDEMEASARASCIAAINAYHRDHMAQLVVCSRTTEYEAAAVHHRLTLLGAVVVQPLTHEDVDTYLAQAGKGRGQASPLLAGLRSALKGNAALRDLATTPLMLNILMLTYQGTSVRDLSDRESLLLQQVWDDYVQRMVVRKGDNQRYPLSKTQAWLSWLARQMRDHNQTVFYLEHLQPDWLGAGQQLAYAGFAIRLPAIVIGFLVSLLIFLFIFGSIDNLPFLLQYGVLGGLMGSLWRGPMEDLWKRQRQHHMWGKRLIKRLSISACIGFLYVLSSGFGPQPSSNQWQTYAFFFYGGLCSLLLQYLLTRPLHSRTSFENSNPRRWKRVVRFWFAVQGPRALLVTIVTGSGIWLIFSGLAFGLNVVDLIYELGVGLSFGLSYTVISSILGTQMEDIHLTERMRWSRRTLLRGLFNSRHLLITGLLTGITTILAGLIYGLSFGIGWYGGLSHALIYWLSFGLSIGLSYWFLLGLSQGMVQERIEDQDRRVANQGIHRSLRNSIIMGIIGGAMVGCLGVLRNALIYGPDYWLGQGLLTSVSGGLLMCMLFGGLAALRHYVIRFWLWRSRVFPWRVPEFLDDATARFLLRRVGGGYSFTHRLLLDHFGDMEKRRVVRQVN